MPIATDSSENDDEEVTSVRKPQQSKIGTAVTEEVVCVTSHRGNNYLLYRPQISEPHELGGEDLVPVIVECDMIILRDTKFLRFPANDGCEGLVAMPIPMVPVGTLWYCWIAAGVGDGGFYGEEGVAASRVRVLGDLDGDVMGGVVGDKRHGDCFTDRRTFRLEICPE